MIYANYKSFAWKFDFIYVSLICLTIIEYVACTFLSYLLENKAFQFIHGRGANTATSIVYIGEFLFNLLIIGLKLTLGQRSAKSEEKHNQAQALLDSKKNKLTDRSSTQ